jgi:hypothetical protein
VQDDGALHVVQRLPGGAAGREVLGVNVMGGCQIDGEALAGRGGEAGPTETLGEPEAPSSIEQAEADVAAVLSAAAGPEGRQAGGIRGEHQKPWNAG